MRTSDLLETDTHFLDGGEQAERAVARIVVEEPGRPSRVVCVAPGGVVRVGRDEDLEVTLGDARVSRLHATLRYDGRAVVVRDLGSRNGTWLGGRRVAGAVAVAAGAHVLVGGARLIVVLGADPGAEATEGEAPAEPAARTRSD